MSSKSKNESREPRFAIAAKGVKPLLGNDLFQKKVEEMTTQEAAEVYAVLDFVEKLAGHRKESLRDKLLDAAAQDGQPTEHGGNLLLLKNGCDVLREKRVSRLPNEEELAALIHGKQLQMTAAFDKIEMWAVNPSKVEGLVKTGVLDAQDVQDLHKVTYALRVKADTELRRMMMEAKASLPKSPKRATRKARAKRLNG